MISFANILEVVHSKQFNSATPTQGFHGVFFITHKFEGTTIHLYTIHIIY